MKLIKLTDRHYIVVDDSEIKEGDYFEKLGEIYCFNKEDFSVGVNENPENRKITHSTKPIEGGNFIETILLSEVEELLFGYSTDNIINDKVKVELQSGNIKPKESVIYSIGLEEGFKKHQELTKDKLFTIDDINAAYDEGLIKYSNKDSGLTRKQFIQSLIPTEWSVTFNEGKLKLL